MVRYRPLQDVHGAGSADMVMQRPEDASGLDGYLSHPKLAPSHALELGAEVDGSEKLHRDASRLRHRLMLTHRPILLKPLLGQRAVDAVDDEGDFVVPLGVVSGKHVVAEVV